MVGAPWTAVCVAQTQPDLLAVFLIDAMMRGHRVSSRAILRTIDRNAI
jgi:hypothetical protein